MLRAGLDQCNVEAAWKRLATVPLAVACTVTCMHGIAAMVRLWVFWGGQKEAKPSFLTVDDEAEVHCRNQLSTTLQSLREPQQSGRPLPAHVGFVQARTRLLLTSGL